MRFSLSVEVEDETDQKLEIRKITQNAENEHEARRSAFYKYRRMGFWVRSIKITKKHV